VPLVVKGETQLVLDVDSDKLNDFDAGDQKYLEAIVELLRQQHFA
jgi:L-methionine (R)-S-oxide reductase